MYHQTFTIVIDRNFFAPQAECLDFLGEEIVIIRCFLDQSLSFDNRFDIDWSITPLGYHAPWEWYPYEYSGRPKIKVYTFG